jgi:threonine/homoserine/homoserine lactone efflux protein
MALNNWWIFLTLTFVVSATPGPNMLLVMTSSARFGFRSAIATMAGCMTALLAMFSLSAAGLGATLQTFPHVFKGVRWLGAAYLAYLGIQAWRAPVRAAAAELPGSLGSEAAPAALYARGLLVSASNPKAILFAAALLPQFIHPDAPKLPQFAILIATFAIVEIAWYAVYASGGRKLAAFLARASVARLFNRATGALFIAFAAAMVEADA